MAAAAARSATCHPRIRQYAADGLHWSDGRTRGYDGLRSPYLAAQASAAPASAAGAHTPPAAPYGELTFPTVPKQLAVDGYGMGRVDPAVEVDGAPSYGSKKKRTQLPTSIVRQKVLGTRVPEDRLVDSEKFTPQAFEHDYRWRSTVNQLVLCWLLGRLMLTADVRKQLRDIFMVRDAPSLRYYGADPTTGRFDKTVMDKLAEDFAKFLIHLFRNWSVRSSPAPLLRLSAPPFPPSATPSVPLPPPSVFFPHLHSH